MISLTEHYEEDSDWMGHISVDIGNLTLIVKAFSSSIFHSDYLTMSSFSSWGTPGDLSMKPEITAPGGNIYSVDGADASGTAYVTMSGTSMAAPQVAGMTALMMEYIRENNLTQEELTNRALAQSLLMSTATPILKGPNNQYYPIQPAKKYSLCHVMVNYSPTPLTELHKHIRTLIALKKI